MLLLVLLLLMGEGRAKRSCSVVPGADDDRFLGLSLIPIYPASGGRFAEDGHGRSTPAYHSEGLQR